jgi:predicted RNase H-like nuclease
MALILGIDAAWTEKGSSGVALLGTKNGERRVLAAHSSYAAFVAEVRGVEASAGDTRPNVELVLSASEEIAGAPVDVVAIDMPLSRSDIKGRRFADDEISRNFGAAWAGTHSPNSTRPGPYGKRIQTDFESAGFALVTEAHVKRPARALIEVYPLAALVRLMRLEKRPPYKTSKRYREHAHSADRIADLLGEWSKIRAALAGEISDMPFQVPERADVRSRSSLKGAEDTLDAIICAWIGARFSEGSAQPFGDSNAAIWLPPY